MVSAIESTDQQAFEVSCYAINQGACSVSLKSEAVSSTASLKNEEASNTLNLSYDQSPPFIQSVSKKETEALYKGDSLSFTLVFNEPILNLDATDFVTYGNSTVAVNRIDDLTYDVTFSGLTAYSGLVSVELKADQDITD